MKKHIYDFRIHADKGGYMEYMKHYRWIVSRVFILLGLPLVAVFATKAFFQHRYIAGWLLVGMLAVILSLFLVFREQTPTEKRDGMFKILSRAFLRLCL